MFDDQRSLFLVYIPSNIVTEGCHRHRTNVLHSTRDVKNAVIGRIHEYWPGEGANVNRSKFVTEQVEILCTGNKELTNDRNRDERLHVALIEWLKFNGVDGLLLHLCKYSNVWTKLTT